MTVPSSDFRKTTVSLDQVSRFIGERAAYAVFDSVGAPRIPEKMYKLGTQQALSLYAGSPFESYTAVAPYLAILDQELFDWIRGEIWEEPWGVMIFTRSPLDLLFEHFRRFLTIQLPNGESAFFRFQDPRILPVFLESAEAQSSGFWNGIAAYGWGQDDAVVIVKRPESIAETSANAPSGKLVFSTDLMRSLGKAQLQDFIDRCAKYFESCDTALPADRDAFFHSILRYAGSVGIKLEIDLLRFMQLVLGWKEMQSMPFVREILTYPEVSGTDKVDMLCEIAAFSTLGSAHQQSAGLNLEANAKASQRFLDEHLNDKQFLQDHPDGALTMAHSDTHLRKDWLKIYNEEIATLAKMTRVQVGSASL